MSHPGKSSLLDLLWSRQHRTLVGGGDSRCCCCFFPLPPIPQSTFLFSPFFPISSNPIFFYSVLWSTLNLSYFTLIQFFGTTAFFFFNTAREINIPSCLCFSLLANQACYVLFSLDYNPIYFFYPVGSFISVEFSSFNLISYKFTFQINTFKFQINLSYLLFSYLLLMSHRHYLFSHIYKDSSHGEEIRNYFFFFL